MGGMFDATRTIGTMMAQAHMHQMIRNRLDDELLQSAGSIASSDYASGGVCALQYICQLLHICTKL
jgi:hypothetical protein